MPSTRLLIAALHPDDGHHRYAHNFDHYDGERFEVGARSTDARQVDKLMHTKIIQAGGKAVDLTATACASRARAWKVIDVYYQGSVSELTTRRSDFSGALAKGGEPALVEHLNALSDKLAK